MIIWMVEAEGIGPNNTNVLYGALKGEVHKALSAWRRTHKTRDGEGPTKVSVRNRDQLIALLDAAMVGKAPEADDDSASEFL